MERHVCIIIDDDTAHPEAPAQHPQEPSEDPQAPAGLPRSTEETLQRRKRRREEKRLQDVEDVPENKMSSESISEASGEGEALTELGTGNTEDALLRDTIEAARWCQRQTFKGKVSLPRVISMNREQRVRALEELHESDDASEDEIMDLREPFMFCFDLQGDYEAFCVEIMDVRHMIVFASFERHE